VKKLLLILLSLSFLLGNQKIYKEDIDNSKLEKMLKNGAVLVDVRTPPEWGHLGVVPGSKLITFFNERGAYNLDDFMKQLEKKGISKNDDVVVICRSGNRSVHVSNMLTAKGYSSVYNVKRGIKGWIREGKSVQKNFY